MPLVDVFGRVVSSDNDSLVVNVPSISDQPTTNINIDFSTSGSFTAESKYETAALYKPGQNILLSSLHVPDYDANIPNGTSLECSFVRAVNVDQTRCKQGYVSLKGYYYNDKANKSNFISEVALWWPSAHLVKSDVDLDFTAKLEARCNEISKAGANSTLPYHGYILRAESDGVLIEYSNPCSCIRDVFPNKKSDYGPITAPVYKHHVDTFTRDIAKRHGEDVVVSVSTFTRYEATKQRNKFNGRPLINADARNIKNLANKKAVRRAGQKDKFGGHVAAKTNAAIVLSNDGLDKQTGDRIQRWVATNVSLSGKQLLTALIAPSPVSNKTLLLHSGLDDVNKRTKSKALAMESSSQDVVEETALTSALSEPVAGELPTVLAAEQMVADTGRFLFIEARRTESGDYIASFQKPGGSRLELQRGDVATRLKAYQSAGLDTAQYKNAMKRINELERLVNEHAVVSKYYEPTMG